MNRITIKQNELPYDVEEEIKSLRTSLQFFREDKKVIMISSCISREGKSSTIYNLAVSLASLNKKVLLVDADVRKGKSVIHITEGKAGKGLTHYLSGQTTLVDIVNATNIPNLHVIFSGPVPPDSTELLSGKAFEKMITTMRGVYD
ncbi:MAG: polysaccharide biosynthesis tyrosine autokinase, partial [Clostridia bacterium]|nr:polysaccharide biosynthesis tyrosine autokinase [Clostridia bacterium]